MDSVRKQKTGIVRYTIDCCRLKCGIRGVMLVILFLISSSFIANEILIGYSDNQIKTAWDSSQQKISNLLQNSADQLAVKNTLIEAIQEEFTQARTTHENTAFQTRLIRLTITLCFLLTLFLVCNRYSKSIARSLSDVQSNVKAVTEEGDLNITFRSSREDDVGNVAAHMDKFVEQLRSTADHLNQLAQGQLGIDVSSRGENDLLNQSLLNLTQQWQTIIYDIRCHSEKTLKELQQQSSSNSILAEGSHRQSELLRTTNKAMKKMGEQMAANAEMATRGNELSAKASTIAGEGELKMAHLVNAMQTINQNSERVTKMLGTIKEIASQTSLLALNAAIEAARAGEYGRGFAVVADETRSLAEKSSKAAEEISKHIEDARNKAINGVDIANETQETLSEIATSVQEFESLMTEISHSSTIQAAEMGELIKEVGEVNATTWRNSFIAKSSEQTQERLENHASRCQKAIGYFKFGDDDQFNLAASSNVTQFNSIIEWNQDEFGINIPEIDAQHKVLFDLLNKLYHSVIQVENVDDQSNGFFSGIINALLQYTVEHFRFEEEWLEAVGFPGYQQHKLEHEQLAAKAVEYANEFEQEANIDFYAFLEFLINWLTGHIKGTDRQFASHLCRPENMQKMPKWQPVLTKDGGDADEVTLF